MNKEKETKIYFCKDSEWDTIANIFNKAIKRKGLNKNKFKAF